MEFLNKVTAQKFDGFEVHTFQINVPIGDCAIHLLVKDAPRYPTATGFDITKPLSEQAIAGKARLFQKPQHRRVVGAGKHGTVFRAILFDGGHDNTGAKYDGRVSAARIEKVIRKVIEKRYIIDNHDSTKGGDVASVARTPVRGPKHDTNKTQLVFDSWVVTHWDKDHYCGSLTMIRNDVYQRWFDKKPARCSYFKYDAQGNCLSVMYCPAWDRPTKGMGTKKGTAKPKGAPSIFVKDLTDKCAAIYLSAKPAIPLEFKARGKVASSELLFKVAHGEKSLMGVDFFTHGQFKPATTNREEWWEEATSNRLSEVLNQPQQYLMVKGPPASAKPTWPFFVCIAVCGRVYGHVGLVDKPPPTLRPALDRPDIETPTIDNYVSIVAVLVWKTDQGLRISHFCGGDAHMNTEMAVLSFLKDPAGKPLQIEVLKAGHHGSRSSTPVDLLLDCKPNKFVISAGDSHGHPSWQTIAILVTYFRRMRAEGTFRLSEWPLLSMRLPYYMLVDGDGPDMKIPRLKLVDMNLESYREGGEENKWQAIFAAAFPGDKEFSLDKPTLPAPAPGKKKVPKTHHSHFKKHFMDNKTLGAEAGAHYLYLRCSVPRALKRMFEKWEKDTNYTTKREPLLALLKNKADLRKKGKEVKKGKSARQKTLEKALEPHLQDQRLLLALFLRRCWNEMSHSGSLYAESEKLGDKMQCVAIYASADPLYDGRTALHGRVGSKKGGVVSRALMWADKKAQLPVRQGNRRTPKLSIKDRAKERVDKWWKAMKKRRPTLTGSVVTTKPGRGQKRNGPQPDGLMSNGPQLDGLQSDGPQSDGPEFDEGESDGFQPDDPEPGGWESETSSVNIKREYPFESDYEDDEIRSVDSETAPPEVEKRRRIEVLEDMEFESDEDDEDLMADDDVDRPGDMARRGDILAQAGAVFDDDDGYGTVGSVVSIEEEKPGGDMTEADSAMSITNLAVGTSSLSLETEQSHELKLNETAILATQEADDGEIADDESTEAAAAPPASVTDTQDEPGLPPADGPGTTAAWRRKPAGKPRKRGKPYRPQAPIPNLPAEVAEASTPGVLYFLAGEDSHPTLQALSRPPEADPESPSDSETPSDSEIPSPIVMVSLLAPKDPIQALLACTGPILFNSPIDGRASADGYYPISRDDLTREYFEHSWRARKDDETFGDPLVRAMTLALSRDATFFRVDDLKLALSMDDTSSPLIFSAKSYFINQAFHSTGGEAGGQSGFDPREAPSEEWMKLSGIDRFPGCVVLALDGRTSGDGGIKTLADMFSLAGLSASPWLQPLLSNTNVTLTKPGAGTPRNAMWFLPGNEFTSCFRLEGSVDLKTSFGGFIQKYLSSWEDKIPAMPVVAKRTVVPAFNTVEKYYDNVGELTLGVELDVGVTRGLGVYASIMEDCVTFMLVSYSPAVGWAALKDWLKKNCEGIMGSFSKLEEDLTSLSTGRKQAASATDDPGSQQQPSTDSNLNGIFWRKLSVTISDEGIHAASIDLEASIPFLVPQGKHAVFNLSFTWEPGMYEFHCSFAGQPPSPSKRVPIQYHFDYERWTHLTPLVKSEPVMSLKYLDPSNELTIPHGVPSEISSLDLSISNTALHFSTQLQSALPPPSPLNADASTLPILRLDRVFLSLDATIDYSSPQTKFSVLLDGTVALKTRYRSDPPFYLAAFIGYTSSPSSWSFRATAANLPMAALYSLFVGGAEQSAVVNMLRAIQLRELSLGYEFTSGAASEVRFEALMGVAGLETAVTFCRSSKTEWSFSATLLPQEAREEEERKMMLGGAVRDLLGEGVVGLLPEVVQGTELLFSGSSERDRFGVVCTRHNDPPRLVFGAELCFGAVQLHFAQVADVTERKATTDAEGKTVKPPSPMVKRVVRVALGLPSIGREFPLIGKLDLPCDEVEFVWASKDVTAEDLNTINAKVDFLTRHPIVMREGDDVLAKGLHFRLLDHGHVLIDHAFSESKAATTETPAPAAGGESGKERDKPAPVTPARGGTEARGKTAPATEAATMAPLKKQKGGLKISGIGLSFDAGVLEIHLDARVSIGPIEAGIRGLAVIFNLSKARGLHDLLKCDVDVRIDGFDMAFDRPPVMLAGALYHARSAQAEVYNGGVAISLRKFSIAALGQYAQVAAKHPDPAYDSFFVYARMEGTLFTVGWAEITGLIAAFGYNSRLRLPDMDSLPSYPFLSGFNSPGGYSLEHTLSSLTGPAGWVTPSMGSLWLAAGVLMRACQTLDIQAVATLALGPDQGEVGLLARAQACLPRGSKPDDALMLIDLSLMGKLDFLHGEFSVQGAIIPTSFILNKNCRPSGEFAVKSWFGDNPHAGDWVVSFGGYHPSFRRPDHYPNPARLRISWAISSNLSVTGEAYAAVTPGAIMAGALLHACFQLGGLTAWFDAHADFLINLKPLHYEAEVAVSAGISYEIRVWFIRTKISVELGATLSLAGPPLGGTVHFDVAIFSFDVHFGDSTRGQPPALGLADFLDLVLTEFAPAESTTKNSPASIKDMYNKAHTLSLTSGRVVDAGGPSPSEADGPPSSSDPWTVRSNDFHFQVRSPVPITTASITSPSPTTPPATSAVNISSRPMHLPSTQSLTSTFSVSVRRTNDINSTESLPFRLAAPLWSPLPSNHWGAYSPTPDSYLDPARSAPTVTHLVGLSVLPPEPKAAESSLPVSATAVAGEPHSTLHVVPLPAPTGTGRYLGRKGEKVKAKLQWERVKAAMEPGGAMIERGEVLREFLEFVVPVTEQERKDGFVGVMGEGPETGVWKAMGERETVRSGFRRIGAGKPRVVLQEPRRFYRCPPMVFCG